VNLLVSDIINGNHIVQEHIPENIKPIRIETGVEIKPAVDAGYTDAVLAYWHKHVGRVHVKSLATDRDSQFGSRRVAGNGVGIILFKVYCRWFTAEEN
jgi:hypothetical protein